MNKQKKKLRAKAAAVRETEVPEEREALDEDCPYVEEEPDLAGTGETPAKQEDAPVYGENTSGLVAFKLPKETLERNSDIAEGTMPLLISASAAQVLTDPGPQVTLSRGALGVGKNKTTKKM